MNENQPTIETQISDTEQGPSSPVVWTLLYDGDCALCRMLAGLLAGPTMAMRQGNDIALADLSQDPPTLVTGAAAWEILIQTEPRLRQWVWLGARLGLTNKTAAGALRAGAHVSRYVANQISAHISGRFCRSCRPLMPLIRKANHNDDVKQEKEAP